RRSSDLTDELSVVKSSVVMRVYFRKTRLRNTIPSDLPIAEKFNGLRLLVGKDSCRRKDHKNTITPKSGGARKTIRHEKKCRMADPKKGAITGVKRKMVMISDMTWAILSPSKRSRTPAIVVINTADAPTPATKRAKYIRESPGANAAAMPPPI